MLLCKLVVTAVWVTVGLRNCTMFVAASVIAMDAFSSTTVSNFRASLKLLVLRAPGWGNTSFLPNGSHLVPPEMHFEIYRQKQEA